MEYVGLNPADWWSIIAIVLPILLFAGLIIFFVRNSGSSNNKAFEFGKTRARLSRHSKVTFADVAGVDEEKQELEEIIDFLKFPKNILKLGLAFRKASY